MDGESQDRIYLSLFRVWQEGHKSKILSTIPDQESFIHEIQELIQILKLQIAEAKQPPLTLIYQKTLTNLRYMAQDLLRLRKAKILSFTQDHQKIDETTLFPFEQEYYRLLYTAFKGYSTSKKGFVQSIENNGFNGHNNAQSSQAPQAPPESTENPPNVPKTKSPISPEHSVSEPKTTPSSSTFPAGDFPSIDTPISGDPPQNPSNVKYNLFRVIKPSEALVGRDLQIYGPLKAEDLIFLPEKNATMLLDEQILLKIKFSSL